MLIDFDYSGLNYRSYDLANYILECELDNSYSAGFPYIAYYT